MFKTGPLSFLLSLENYDHFSRSTVHFHFISFFIETATFQPDHSWSSVATVCYYMYNNTTSHPLCPGVISVQHFPIFSVGHKQIQDLSRTVMRLYGLDTYSIDRESQRDRWHYRLHSTTRDFFIVQPPPRTWPLDSNSYLSSRFSLRDALRQPLPHLCHIDWPGRPPYGVQLIDHGCQRPGDILLPTSQWQHKWSFLMNTN